MDEHTPTPEPLTIGSSLRQARTRMGLSLRDLEAITHISRPMLHRLERDQIDQPNPRLLHRLAETLELNSDDLFALAGYRPSTQLPTLAPYLRAKYQLPPEAVAEAQVALEGILARYEREQTVASPAAETPSSTEAGDQGPD